MHSSMVLHDGRAADVIDQVSLTLSTGAKAILQELAREYGASMSCVVESMIIDHPRAEAIRRTLTGLFPGGSAEIG